jgi:NADH-quinone oxidoreductase subunit N
VALATVLIVAGVGFKLSLVPFHAWTPTAYAGSSVPVATFLATVSKIAALAALLVVLRAVAALGTPALLSIALLASLSMTLGNVMALRQDDVVRLLAWSTVAQAGWVVVPLLSVSSFGARAAAGYLLTYVVATLVAFTAVMMTVSVVGARRGRQLAAYTGLVRTHPWAGGALLLALTSLAGLPPGVLGLIGKIVALRPVLAEGWWVVGVLAAANAVLGVAVYLRWVRVLLQPAPEAVQEAMAEGGTGTVTAVTRVRTHPSHLVALGIGSAVLVLGSVQPDLLFGLLG